MDMWHCYYCFLNVVAADSSCSNIQIPSTLHFRPIPLDRDFLSGPVSKSNSKINQTERPATYHVLIRTDFYLVALSAPGPSLAKLCINDGKRQPSPLWALANPQVCPAPIVHLLLIGLKIVKYADEKRMQLQKFADINFYYCPNRSLVPTGMRERNPVTKTGTPTISEALRMRLASHMNPFDNTNNEREGLDEFDDPLSSWVYLTENYDHDDRFNERDGEPMDRLPRLADTNGNNALEIGNASVPDDGHGGIEWMEHLSDRCKLTECEMTILNFSV
jgi:hypothetical protein